MCVGSPTPLLSSCIIIPHHRRDDELPDNASRLEFRRREPRGKPRGHRMAAEGRSPPGSDQRRSWSFRTRSPRGLRTARGLDRCPPHRALHRVGLGTMLFGTTLSEDEARRLLDRAHLHHGVSFFDTAEMYPVPRSSATQGDNERILGAWVRDRIRRGALRREGRNRGDQGLGPVL